MSAPTGLGLAGIIPGRPTQEEVVTECRALAALGLSAGFHEVIGGRVYRFERDRMTEVEEPALRDWLLEGWSRTGGGDLSYADWAYLWDSAQILIPDASPRRGSVKLPRLGGRYYQAIHGMMGPDPERPGVAASVIRAHNVAYEYDFLFTISG
jgi:hypothetical protein